MVGIFYSDIAELINAVKENEMQKTSTLLDEHCLAEINSKENRQKIIEFNLI